MPPMGPGGMPDLSKLNPSQMRAMQVRFLLFPCAFFFPSYTFLGRANADSDAFFFHPRFFFVFLQSMLPAGAREMMQRPGAMEEMQKMMSGMGGGLPNLGGMGDMLKGMMGGR